MTLVTSCFDSTVPKEVVLQVMDLEKSFGPTRVLRGVSLALMAGEAHALLGENGSGKSTVAKILCGLHARDAGQVLLAGEACALRSPADAALKRIGMVFQELSLAPHLSVMDNLFLGREICSFGLWVDHGAQRAASIKVLKRVGLEIDPDRPVSELSMAEKQLIEIAKALLADPQVMIFDEPTACLAEAEVARLFVLVGELKAQGIAILYVTHHLREVLQMCDRLSLIRDGKILSTQAITAETKEAALVDLLTGGRFNRHQRAHSTRRQGAPLVRLRDVCTPSSTTVSIDIFPGEVVGVYGVMGCGREGILRALSGLQAPLSGTIQVKGKPYRARTPRDAQKQGVAYLCGDRKEGGIFGNLSLRENYTMSSLGRFMKHGLIDGKREAASALDGLSSQKVVYADAEQPITSLSGGNQQKVLFGRALATHPDLLVMEDPTAGIDVGAKQDLYRQVSEATQRGMSCLWASSDIVETLLLCDRVYAMSQGRIVAELINPQLEDEPLLMRHVLNVADTPFPTPSDTRADAPIGSRQSPLETSHV